MNRTVYLSLFSFETGDSTCPHWIEPVIISSTLSYAKTYEMINQRLQVRQDEDLDYGDIVENTLSSFENPNGDISWFPFNKATTIDSYMLFYS